MTCIVAGFMRPAKTHQIIRNGHAKKHLVHVRDTRHIQIFLAIRPIMNGHDTIQKIQSSCCIHRANIQVHIFSVAEFRVESSKALQKIAPEHADIHLRRHHIDGEAIRSAKFVKLITHLRSALQAQTQTRLPMFPDALAIEPGLLVGEQEIQLLAMFEGLYRSAQILEVGPKVIIIQERDDLPACGRNTSIAADSWRPASSRASRRQQQIRHPGTCSLRNIGIGFLVLGFGGVVNHQNFKIRIILIQDRIECGLDELGSVSRWNDDGNFHIRFEVLGSHAMLNIWNLAAHSAHQGEYTTISTPQRRLGCKAVFGACISRTQRRIARHIRAATACGRSHHRGARAADSHALL